MKGFFRLVRSSVTTTTQRDGAGRPLAKTTATTATYASKGVAATAPQVPQVVITAPESTSTPMAPASKCLNTVVSSIFTLILVGQKSRLAKKVGKELMKKAVASGARASATGAKVSRSLKPPSTIVTKKGPVPAVTEVVLEQTVERGVQGEHVSELMTGYKYDEGKKLEMNIQHL